MTNQALEERRLRMSKIDGCGALCTIADQLTTYIQAHTQTDKQGRNLYTGDPEILIRCKECYDLIAEKERALDKHPQHS